MTITDGRLANKLILCWTFPDPGCGKKLRRKLISQQEQECRAEPRRPRHDHITSSFHNRGLARLATRSICIFLGHNRFPVDGLSTHAHTHVKKKKSADWHTDELDRKLKCSNNLFNGIIKRGHLSIALDVRWRYCIYILTHHQCCHCGDHWLRSCCCPWPKRLGNPVKPTGPEFVATINYQFCCHATWLFWRSSSCLM